MRRNVYGFTIGDGYPEPPEILPMDEQGLSAVLEEFTHRYRNQPGFATGDSNTRFFFLSESENSPYFGVELELTHSTFSTGIEIGVDDETYTLLDEFFELLTPGLLFGDLDIHDQGVQWYWRAPSVHYPYFHALVEHSQQYARFLDDVLWPVVRELANGELSLQEAFQKVQRKAGETSL